MSFKLSTRLCYILVAYRTRPNQFAFISRIQLTYFIVGHFHYVLSLGAVLSLFAAFYYWIGKMTGYNYNEKWALIHFWVFLIAINIVFFPKHFLGKNGMPRRISDYTDGFAGWNHFMTLGSILTVISVILFLYIVSNTI